MIHPISLTSLLPPPPLVDCANEPPHFPCFRTLCRVHTERATALAIGQQARPLGAWYADLWESWGDSTEAGGWVPLSVQRHVFYVNCLLIQVTWPQIGQVVHQSSGCVCHHCLLFDAATGALGDQVAECPAVLGQGVHAYERPPPPACSPQLAPFGHALVGFCVLGGPQAELTLDSGNPKAARCKGNSAPEDFGCDPSLCPRLPDAVVVELVEAHWVHCALQPCKSLKRDFTSVAHHEPSVLVEAVRGRPRHPNCC